MRSTQIVITHVMARATKTWHTMTHNNVGVAFAFAPSAGAPEPQHDTPI